MTSASITHWHRCAVCSASARVVMPSGGSSQWLSDAQLLVLVRSTFAEFDGAYGAPRIYRELQANKHPVSKERILRLMKQAGLKARHKRCYKVRMLVTVDRCAGLATLISKPNAGWIAGKSSRC